MLLFFVKGKTDLQRQVHHLNYNSDMVIEMLSKWLEKTEEDSQKKDDDASSQGTSKKSNTVKHSFRKNQREKVSDDPRSKRED